VAYSLNLNVLLQAPIAIAYLDKNLCYVGHSLKWCEEYGLEDLDLIGKHHYDVFPEIGTEWRDKHQHILKTGQQHSHDAEKFIRHDGSIQYIKWNVSATRDIDGNINGLSMVTEDVTQIINKGIDREREHQLLLDAAVKARIGSWEMNHVTGELYWSQVTKEIHEVPDDFVPNIATGIKFYKPGISQETVTDCYTRSYTTGEEFEVELQLITATGKEKWVRSVLKADIVNGKCLRQYGTFEDITDKVEQDINYKLALKKFKDVFDVSGIGMLVVDPIDFRITEVNPQVCSMLNYEEDMLKQLSLEQLVSRDHFAQLFDGVTDLLNLNSKVLRIQIELKRSTGRYVICSLIGTLIQDEDGNPIDLIIELMDISNIKKKEQELRSFARHVEQQNERLLNFAHIVSHNLRSHSSNFEVLLSLYNYENGESEKDSIIELLNSSSKQLASTIGHLNEVVAINTRKIELVSIDLKENILNVMDNISTLIKEHRVDIDLQITDDFKVNASAAYLESIVLNLLTNSIKYRREDVPTKISIRAFNYRKKTRIIFEDNGTGIDMKLNGHKIFGMYKTFHGNSDARGIGLYMTKNQVEAMGGTIRVKSKKNQGTTFKITL
jgi:PAS domain S-box-containing protein